ncbi:MAG: PQQ-binding-like beta-propeller repeat protein [Vicinamibacterales bacterium]|nr:PQQ-binding-like beta-propeller repeat protein [Vicinamibacterales bacterium]
MSAKTSLLAAGAFVALATIAGLSAPADSDWTSYGGTASSSRYWDSKEITKANVGKLEAVWSYPYGEAGFHPIIVHGTVYTRGRNGALIALDAKTGRELWIHDGMDGMTTRGLNYWESKDGKDRRLIFSMNDYLQEIDAKTGKSIASFGSGGVVDLREGLGRDPATVTRIQSGTPGQVFENLILLGSAPGEGYMSPPGDLRAYDVITGKLAWQFHTVPHPGEFGYETWPKDAWKYIGGTNTWGELSIDEKRGIAFFPTGSPTYDYYGADRPGMNLFSDCLIALDARTGKRLWHFQTTHHDLWDFDNNAAPQLTTIKKDGRSIDVVALAGKTGFLYVFDRVTGTPIWPIEERPVPKSEMPGEQSWPTQPFPTQPPPFVRQKFTVDDINPYANVTPEAREAFKERFAKANNVGMFTPISLIDTLHIPGSNGGAVFGTTAAEPTTGMVYVVGQDNPGLLKLLPPGAGRGGQFAAALAGQPLFVRECSSCHGEDRAGTNMAPTLLTLSGRLDAETIKNVMANGRNEMPAFPNLTGTEADQIIAYLLAPARGGGPGGRGTGLVPVPPAPGLVVASGSAVARPDAGGRGRGRGAPPVYPEGVEPNTQYVIDSYGTIGTMMKPPYTTITAYDLNKPAIKWQVGFGDDPRLAAAGITGTGITQMRNSIIVTASGLIFGVGGDGKLRVYDSDNGKLLWTSSRGDASVRGSPSFYEVDGRMHVLTPVAAEGAIQWVSFALPRR